MSTKSTKSTKSIKSTQSRVSARTYRARRRLAALLVALLAVCLWLAGANWGMAHAVAQAEPATSASTSHVMDVEKAAVPAPKPSEAAPKSQVAQAQPSQAQPSQQAASQPQAQAQSDAQPQAQPEPQPQAQLSQAQSSQAQAQSDAQPTDVQAYRAWLASLPQSLDDIPACQVETGENIDAEADGGVTVYMPVCRWDASISGNGQGESYVLAYGQKVMSLNYR